MHANTEVVPGPDYPRFHANELGREGYKAEISVSGRNPRRHGKHFKRAGKVEHFDTGEHQNGDVQCPLHARNILRRADANQTGGNCHDQAG
jgi:hypothetical protein